MIVEKIDRTQPYVLSGNNIFIKNNYFSQIGGLSFYGLSELCGQISPRFQVTNEEIIGSLTNNKLFRNYLLNRIKIGVYNFNVVIFDDKTARIRKSFSLEDLKDYLNRFKTKKNSRLLDRILEAEKVKSKESSLYGFINNQHSYLFFFDMLRDKPEDFKRKLNNNLYGISGKKTVELIGAIDWYEFTKGIVDEREREIIKENFEYLLYNYQEYEEMQLDFEPYDGYIEEVDLNPEVMALIKEDMPEDLNQIERIYFAYRRICQLFSYDEHEVFGGALVRHCFPSQVSQLKPGDSITCNQATMMFCKYLEKEGIPFRVVGYDLENETKYNKHLAVIFKTDEMIIHADPSNRQIKNDLSASKCLYPTKFFNVFGNNFKAKKDLDEYKHRVDGVLENHYLNEEYKRAKEVINYIKRMDKSGLSVKDRIDLAINAIAKIKMQPIDMPELIDDLTLTLFGDNNPFFDVKIIVKKPENEEEKSKFVLCVASNEIGLQDDYENNAYTIIREGNVLETLPWDEMIENIGYNDKRYRQLKKVIPGLEPGKINSKERQK